MTSKDATVAPEGIDADGVTAWFCDHVPGVEPPLSFDLIAGGRSNLTYAVTDQAEHRWVLRRPPLGHVLATAHDMSREHRIISALAPTDVPVPPTHGLCEDESVNGAPFYVMGFVDGVVVRDATVAQQLEPAHRRRASESVADTLLRIHAVDPSAVGLGDLGRHEGYLERQLKRWYGQFQKSQQRDIPEVDRVHDRLVADVPEQQAVTIVHGDYRLDNCMLGADHEVAAVLDWELCTLGDPLADVGLLLVYWVDADDSALGRMGWPGAADGFLTRDQMLERYAAGSPLDLERIDYYTAFGYWKLACILEGVYARYRAGAMGSDAKAVADLFEDLVVQLAREAERRAGG